MYVVIEFSRIAFYFLTVLKKTCYGDKIHEIYQNVHNFFNGIWHLHVCNYGVF